MNEFSSRLIKLRKLKHLTQESLAKELNVSDKVVSKWECGESLPQIEYVVKLGKIFDVSLDYLINGIASAHDKVIINRPPTTGELADIFLKQCLNIIKESGLEKYKAILMPKKVIGRAVPEYGEHVTALSGGVFKGDKYFEWQNVVSPYIDLDKLLRLDNYDIYEKLKKYPTTYGETRFLAKMNNDIEILKMMPEKHSSDFYHDRAIREYTAKQIQGLTDIRFYQNLKGTDECKDCLQDEPLNYALEHLEATNPNYWKIVEILINRGATKLTCTYDSYRERGVYVPDILTTQMLLQMARQNNK